MREGFCFCFSWVEVLLSIKFRHKHTGQNMDILLSNVLEKHIKALTTILLYGSKVLKLTFVNNYKMKSVWKNQFRNET